MTITLQSIREPIPPSAIRAQLQADGSVIVYMPGDELPPAPEPQPEVPQVPQSVTMRQARAALIEADLIDAVEAAINAIPDAKARRLARNVWEQSTTVERNRGLVSQMAPALGLTSAQIDALFIAAAQIP
jgi:hypothetical protein